MICTPSRWFLAATLPTLSIVISTAFQMSDHNHKANSREYVKSVFVYFHVIFDYLISKVLIPSAKYLILTTNYPTPRYVVFMRTVGFALALAVRTREGLAVLIESHFSLIEGAPCLSECAVVLF